MKLFELELEIFFHSDSTTSLKDLGLDYDIEECVLRTVTFWEPPTVIPHYDNGRKYTTLNLHGQDYISPLDPEDVKKKIRRAAHDCLL